MTLFALLQHSLFYGLILSMVLSAAVIGLLRYNPELLLRSYPPDVKARYGPARPETVRQRKFIIGPLFIFIAALFTVAVWQVTPLTFFNAFVCVFVVMMTFNLVDLLILDWLLLGLFLPKFAILPGTDGMAGYKDYSFAFKGFLKGCVISAGLGLAAAGIAVGLPMLF